MDLEQAIWIVKDHIRVGKAMELTNGVPRALEMVLEELERLQKCYEVTNESWRAMKERCEATEKALELACEALGVGDCPACMGIELDWCEGQTECDIPSCWKQYFLAQAKEATDANS